MRSTGHNVYYLSKPAYYCTSMLTPLIKKKHLSFSSVNKYITGCLCFRACNQLGLTLRSCSCPVRAHIHCTRHTARLSVCIHACVCARVHVCACVCMPARTCARVFYYYYYFINVLNCNTLRHKTLFDKNAFAI